MIEKINKWLPSVTFVWLVVLTLVLVGGNNQSDTSSKDLGVIGTRYPNGLSVGTSTSPSTTGEFYAAVKNTLIGTTTISQSPDGFILWSAYTVSTTSPVRANLTNSGTDLVCDGASLSIYSTNGTNQFGPPYQFVVGTTTTVGAYSANLMASSTIATSTAAGTVYVQGVQTKGVIPWNFNLPGGSAISLSVGDKLTGANVGSSTNFGNISGEVSIHCWTTGQ